MMNKSIKACCKAYSDESPFARIQNLDLAPLCAAISGLVYILFILCFAACTQADHLTERDSTTVRFSLVSHAVDAQVTPTRADAANMAAGTTVRVLAYRRANGAAEAVLSSACYAGEATYKVTALGALQADSDPMQLVAGNYDFYALTPALEVDHSGSAPKVEVRHREDYAVSLTSGTITSDNGMVNLHALERRCALLTFETDLKEGVTSITSAQITAVSLTAMTDEPLTGTGIAALPATVGNTGLTLSEFEYPDENKPYQSRAEAIVLPKSVAAFRLAMKVAFDGAEPIDLTADVGTMPFLQGKRYAFAIRYTDKVTEVEVELVLQVSPWTGVSSETDTGTLPEQTVTVVLGAWTEVACNGASMGEVTEGKAPVSISGWTSFDFSSQLGSLGDNDASTNVPGWSQDGNNTETGKPGDSDASTGVPGWSQNGSNTETGKPGDSDSSVSVPGWGQNGSNTEVSKPGASDSFVNVPGWIQNGSNTEAGKPGDSDSSVSVPGWSTSDSDLSLGE